MNFYEVVLGIVNCGKEIGKVIVPVRANNRFEAAITAESAVENQYGREVYGHAVKIDQLTMNEFNYSTAA